jgi:hypothetical protein
MKAVIISDNNHIGHLSHSLAFYRLCENVGLDVTLYIHKDLEKYIPSEYNAVFSDKGLMGHYDVAIIYSPSVHNLGIVIRLRMGGCRKIFYVFHEPISSFKPFKEAGFSNSYILKLRLGNIYQTIMTYMVDGIILASNQAIQQYCKSKVYRKNAYDYMPLIFDDESSSQSSNREFFSYIGTVAADHSFQEYLDFVCYAIKHNRLPNINFLIATKSSFEVPVELQTSDRVVIQQGRPMSNSEINEFYSKTFVVWNAYERSMQSGVLAKSFMFGTPAIVLRKNLSEFTQDGVEVKSINCNTDKEEIETAVGIIVNNFIDYSTNCRKRFLETFYYKKYNTFFRQLLNL